MARQIIYVDSVMFKSLANKYELHGGMLLVDSHIVLVDNSSNKGQSVNYKSEFTFNEAKKIAEQMGIIDAGNLIRTLQVLNIINLKAEPKEAGLPVGFHFPWSERDNWTKMCTALQQQGFKIIKDDA